MENSKEVKTINIEDHTVQVNVEDLSFPVLDYGEGPPVVLLHGFPDSRHLWRYQIPALAEEGYRVIAPDMRGYGDAPKPGKVEDYVIYKAIEDIKEILKKLNITETKLIAHDWGSAVGWLLASLNPEIVEKFVTFSVGAPNNSKRYIIEQFEKSWYFYFFQFEGVAEEWLKHDDWKLFREWTRNQGDTEKYIENLSEPGALTAAINWYRANVEPKPPEKTKPDYPDITCPVLGVWSDQDPFLTEEYLKGSKEKVKEDWNYEKITGAGHWMMLDKPKKINRLLLDFL